MASLMPKCPACLAAARARLSQSTVHLTSSSKTSSFTTAIRTESSRSLRFHTSSLSSREVSRRGDSQGGRSYRYGDVQWSERQKSVGRKNTFERSSKFDQSRSNPKFQSSGRRGSKPSERAPLPSGFQHGKRSAGRPTLTPKQVEKIKRAQKEENAQAEDHWLRISSELVERDVTPDIREVRARKDSRFVPGDLVELRRQASTYVGIILASPDDQPAESDKGTRGGSGIAAGAGSTLYVLLTSGFVSPFRATDVMLHYPGMLDEETARKATPISKQFVGDPRGAGSSTDEGNEDAAESVDSSSISAAAIEPVDEARFNARASLCTALRIVQMKTHQEMQHLSPAFSALYLREAAQELVEEEGTSTISTMQAAREMTKWLKEDPRFITRARYLATHTLLMDHPKLFLADVSAHRASQLFTRRSQSELSLLDEVTQWACAPEGSAGWNKIEALLTAAKRS